MPREHKIGMTLLILAVGLGGAFLFRKPSAQEETALPGLQGEARINQQLAELRTRPLLPGIDLPGFTQPVGHSSSTQLPGGLDLQSAPLSGSRKGQATPPIGGLTEPKSAEAAHSANVSSRNPLRTSMNSQGPRQLTNLPELNSEGIPAFHVVQPGETLSGIAVQYFGSAGRYQELYDANQDLLPSPNHLRPGMKLRIPGTEPTVPIPTDPAEVREAEIPVPPRVSVQPDSVDSRKKQPAVERKASVEEWTILEEKPGLSKVTPAKSEASALPAPATAHSETRRKLFVPARRTPFLQRSLTDSAILPEQTAEEADNSTRR